jgi:endonuclease III
MAKKFKVNTEEAKERVSKIFPLLKKEYPDAKCELNHNGPLELLVATIMSAQCTDVRVNIVTKDLFKKYRSATDFANAKQTELEEDIRTTGFYRNKAKNIIACCKQIVEQHNGEVPGTMEELTALQGVGRKSANVLLGNAFDVPGMVCDTHVIRLSRRLQLSENSDPVKLELDLQQIVPQKRGGGWTMFSHLIVWHGRYRCKARKPDCDGCVIAKHCPSANNPDLL